LNIKLRQKDFDRLRNDYPFFEYNSYHYELDEKGLQMTFDFNISNQFRFSPTMFVPAKAMCHWQQLSSHDLNNLVFHVGMVELVSYWKITCSPQILIKPHALDSYQTEWWKKLYWHGLGEFLYLNGIEVDQEHLMHITSTGKALKPLNVSLDKNAVMVPVGGGKDSVVTLELLRSSQLKVFPMAVNVRPAISRTIHEAGFADNQVLEVRRQLDPLMLQLNKEGFLNGHTPFSALLAFTSALLAVGGGIGNIALSNESSANQSTVPGTKINHQYSKSFEFEQDFDTYCRKYIHPELHYFSFLRPVNELQIAALFSRFTHHHAGFRSCNVGSKQDAWCGECPKCMFTYIMLASFIPDGKLLEIFHVNPLENNSLSNIFNELTGKATIKPFECVGTPEEVNVALSKAFQGKNELPELLKNYLFDSRYAQHFERLMNDFSDEHALPPVFLSILKNALHDQPA